ncbi:helix-hairpin-helix domain-containing protein [Halopiger xanaduensis]|uniref:Uncharacterized protein n=1 Tax=Halopiger xanaduensis (strain DSM 18323 / JCM 14033 / SH-6) TaxID=797210 RepID=F8DET4_HALXS|nr:helix-hairpin-helix domain-containing protein [Halopiger xanaduensis]AEH39524.1 hypothetical protein Halxa_0284 [Halopiger xanaduensis SH-6]
MFRDPSWLSVLIILGAVVLSILSTVKERLSSDPNPTNQRVAELQDKRVDGLIDEQEFERRLEFVLDERNARIRAVVETVPGIGDNRSKAIAREYDDLEDLRESDRERLESVPDIGEQRAENVLERVRE